MADEVRIARKLMIAFQFGKYDDIRGNAMNYSPGRSPLLSIHEYTSDRCCSNCSTQDCISASWLSNCSIFSVYGRIAWLKACAKRSGIGSVLFVFNGAGSIDGIVLCPLPFDIPRGEYDSCGACWRGYISFSVGLEGDGCVLCWAVEFREDSGRASYFS